MFQAAHSRWLLEQLPALVERGVLDDATAERLRRHCEAVGRNYADIVKSWSADATAVAATEAEAQRIAAASPYNEEHAIIGTPAQVAERLQAFVDLGVTYLIVRLLDFPNTAGIELFIEEVMPHLAVR